jgi:hypothetical protein
MSLGSALAGALGNRKQKQTQTSTATPTFAPEVRPALNTFLTQAQQMVQNPSAGIDPLRVSARERVNANYAGVPEMLSQKYGRNAGWGASGRFGTAAAGAEFQRIGQLSDLEGQFLQAALQQKSEGLGALQSILALGRGSTQTGETVMPGNMLAGGVNSGLQTASMLYSLNKLLKG